MDLVKLIGTFKSQMKQKDARRGMKFDGKSTALGILKTRCTENLFSWTNLYPAVNAEQLQDFTSLLALA
ncbi:hypothetical protein H5410_020170 [Solanum commersonii]|uniref:Uncharacterized protein n=1 Tax=Solanum commersonii TaxID=4109 RepID=A0A9J5Z7N0_SOLCO|nr:hypothetical protein H5410_020170 [Solanum commersonii]